MITAIVLIDCASDSIPEVAEALVELPGVSEVYSVAGGVDLIAVAEALVELPGVSEVYSVAGGVDLIAVVRVREFDQVAEVIAGGISKTKGVLGTDTHIAFRAYSKHDLEGTFSLGFPDA